MRLSSYFFYYTYIGTVVLAGFWGAFIGPALDFKFLLLLDLQAVQEEAQNTVLSQYRFLRALEFGFGFWCLYFTDKIFTERMMNTAFLSMMALGILGRVAGIVVDGFPSNPMLVFMIWEIIGIILIYFYTKGKLDETRRPSYK